MIEPPAVGCSLHDAIVWTIRALRDEDFLVLLCGRSALDFQGEKTGSTDVDILIGTDFKEALYVLDAYADRGDLDLIWGTQGQVVRYLVRGGQEIDVLNVASIHPDLFQVLWDEAGANVPFGGSAGDVRAVTREGYFVLAVMYGLQGFALDKEDPMWKVRESWGMFGKRTDSAKVEAILARLGFPTAFRDALRE